MRGLRRALWIAVGIAAVVWSLPALYTRVALAEFELERFDRKIQVSFDGVWPAFPFGVQVAHVNVRSGGRALELTDARTRLFPDGLRLDASLGNGGVHAELPLDAAEGFARFADLPVEQLALALPIATQLSGVADGELRWGTSLSLEGRVADGSIRSLNGFAIRFEELAGRAALAEAGVWDVDHVHMRGPPLTFSGSGRIGPYGALNLVLEVRQLEEPARSYLRLLGVEAPALPFVLEVRGRLSRPALRVSSAQ